MALPITLTKILTAANSTVVATSQTRASSGPVTLSSGPPVTLDTQRRIQIVLTASNSGAIFTVNGTNDGGTPIGESITVGATATTITTSMDYKSITAMTATTLTGNLIAGTNSTGSTPWQATNPLFGPQVVNIAVSLTASGAATFSGEYTLDIDPVGLKSNAALTSCVAFTMPLLSAGTNNAVGIITQGTSAQPVPCSAWRLTVTAGTGGLKIEAVEPGVD